MQPLARFLRSKVGAGRDEVIIVQVPNDRRPGIVQHPLNHYSGFVLAARLSKSLSASFVSADVTWLCGQSAIFLLHSPILRYAPNCII